MESRVFKALEDRKLELGPPPASTIAGSNLRLTRDEDGIAWLLFDKSDLSANTLSDEVLKELDATLAIVEREAPKGLVIRSAKPSGFIAGADINAFSGATDAAAIEQTLGNARKIVERLAALKMPTVAVVHGFCLGGGLEIALACKKRIAIKGATFGFPEVQLGLHPGLGGTARSTHLIDPVAAMTAMLTGRSLHTAHAKALGLVDAITEERHVRNAVHAAIDGGLKAARPGLKVTIENGGMMRGFLAGRIRKQTSARASRTHYPAPFALIDLWARYGGDSAAMMRAETASFARLVVTDTAQNLIRDFQLREQFKKLGGGNREFQHVHVIGAGAMGGDIAAWCAWQGLRVTLADMKPEPIAAAIRRAAELYGKLSHEKVDVRDALDRLIPDLRGEGVRQADVVIEAVPEKLELKHKVYAGVEPLLKAGAILATNTSSIPLDDLSAGLKMPERLVGIHFFNPVSRLELVEVVSHRSITPETLAAARAFAGRIERLPLPVKSAPGFLVNRVLTPYLLEAMVMLDEGMSRETIDGAAEHFGMPVGPIELADDVGLDICLDVAQMLKEKLSCPLPELSDRVRQKVKAKELGRKTGRGLYDWKDGKAVKTPSKAIAPTPEMIDRLILPMLNACVSCLREGIVTDPDLIDGAMIFGTGFAPFRGGPLHYARAEGVDRIVSSLRSLAGRFGERFAPDAGWAAFSRVA